MKSLPGDGDWLQLLNVGAVERRVVIQNLKFKEEIKFQKKKKLPVYISFNLQDNLFLTAY